MDTIATLKKRLQSMTQNYIRRPGAVISRTVLLGLTVYGLITMGAGESSVIAALMAMLRDISKEVAPGVIEDILQRWTSSGSDVTPEDIIASIDRLNSEEQSVISILTEHLGVLEVALKEILETQNVALLDEFRILLEEWQVELDPATLHAMMQEILERMERLEKNERQIITELEAIQGQSRDVTQHLRAQKNEIDAIQQQLIAIMRLVQTLDRRSFEQLRGLRNVSNELQLLRQDIKDLQSRIHNLQQSVNETNRILNNLIPPSRQASARRRGFDVETITGSIWEELNKAWNEELKDMFH